MHYCRWTSLSACTRPVPWSEPQHQVNTLFLVTFQKNRTSDILHTLQGLLNTRSLEAEQWEQCVPAPAATFSITCTTCSSELPLSTWKVQMCCWGHLRATTRPTHTACTTLLTLGKEKEDLSLLPLHFQPRANVKVPSGCVDSALLGHVQARSSVLPPHSDSVGPSGAQESASLTVSRQCVAVPAPAPEGHRVD